MGSGFKFELLGKQWYQQLREGNWKEGQVCGQEGEMQSVGDKFQDIHMEMSG